MAITHAVIPAAGIGTRFLPFTKSVPKELVPILNRPVLELILEEIHHASLNDVCIVISPEKQILRHFCSPNPALDLFLSAHNKLHLLDKLKILINRLRITWTLQDEPRGLGDAIAHVYDAVHTNTFAVILPDDLISGTQTALEQLIATHSEHQGIIVGVCKVQPDQVSSYGIITIAEALSPSIFRVSHVVEKPAIADTPSLYGIVGRYILTAPIFDALEHIVPGYGKEIQLTDAIAYLIAQGHPVYARVLEGIRFDVGTPQGWLAANNYYAQQELL